MKKDYIVELREEEADELMDDHWVGELVRCKNCKYYNNRKCDEGYGWCERNGTGHGTTGDWFCADGERKTE